MKDFERFLGARSEDASGLMGLYDYDDRIQIEVFSLLV